MDYLGISVPSMSSFTIVSGVMPSISFSGDTTTRWRRASAATLFTSSGITKSLPLIAALALAALSMLIDARGDAPRYSIG